VYAARIYKTQITLWLRIDSFLLLRVRAALTFFREDVLAVRAKRDEPGSANMQSAGRQESGRAGGAVIKGQ
jgi:hypothetical protein